MTLLTTTIGAYPKPAYVTVPDWFNSLDELGAATHTRRWAEAVAALGDDAAEMFARGTRDAVHDQTACGIDIPTDGEIRREDYISYHCRHLEGIDFAHLTSKEIRGGAMTMPLPTIVGPVKPKGPFLPGDWQCAQNFSDKPVKITLPGPMTITETTADAYYDDPRRLGADLADALSTEVRALVRAGCRQIQIDEPLFARKSAAALDYGVENLERAWHGCPDHVTRTVHICCGYPDRMDSVDYPKAPPQSYFDLADALESCKPIDVLSIEDAHRHNDLALLERFRRTRVVLGVVAIASSALEPVDSIRDRLEQALAHIEAERLIAAPDCGLGLLGRELAMDKLRNLCDAAHSVG